MIAKKLILPLVLAGVLVIGIGAATGKVLADDQIRRQPLVEKIASHFGLDQTEVEEFMTEAHQERWQEMKQAKQERLDQAVSDGVITEAQKQALLTKHETMQAQGQAKRQAHQQEMQAWFEANGIDHEALMEYMGGFGFGGPAKAGCRGFGKLQNNN